MALVLVVGLSACSGGSGSGSEPDTESEASSTTLTTAPDPDEVVIDAPVTSNVTIDASSDGGTVAVGWYTYDEEDAAERAMVAVSADGGRTFGSPTVVAEPAVQFPDVVVLDDGTILVGSITYDVATLIDPEDERSWPGWPVIHRSTDGGATFEVMADLRATVGDRVLTGGMPTSFAASGDGSTMVFGFQDATPPAFVADGEPARVEGTSAVPTFALVSIDGGATFRPPQAIASSTCNCCQSSAFVADDRAGVAVRLLDPVGDAADERDPGLALADAAGEFEEAVEIHDDGYRLALDGCPASGPAVTEVGGIAHSAWWTGADDRQGWWYSRGTSVTTLDAPVALEAPYSITYAVHLAADPTGQAWVVGMHWPDETAGSHLWLWHVDAEGTPALLDATPPVAEAAQAYDIAAVDDHALVTWIADDAVHVLPVGP